MARKVEVFIGVDITNDDGSQDRYAETGKLEERMATSKLVAIVGMKTLKKILSDIREKP